MQTRNTNLGFAAYYREDRRRELGGMLLSLLMIVVIFAVATGVGALCVANLNMPSENDSKTRCFFLADSGAQAGLYQLRVEAEKGIGTFTEQFAGGTFSVQVAQSTGDRYSIRSTGSLGAHRETVEMVVQKRTDTPIDAALGFFVNPGARMLDARVPVRLVGGKVSGLDHTPSGDVTEDQSLAVHGLAINSKKREVTFEVRGTGILEGAPADVTHDASPDFSIVRDLRNYARTHADRRLGAATMLDARHNGDFGTASDPVLVYGRFDGDGRVLMRRSFSGHGTLVLEVRHARGSFLRIKDRASWYGPIVILLRGKSDLTGGALVRVEGASRVVGGISVFFFDGRVSFQPGGGTPFVVTDDAEILYSSELNTVAKGITQVAPDFFKVVAFRKVN